MNKLLLLSFAAVVLVSSVAGHGRMLNPISRSSLWRFQNGTNIVVNPEDDFLSCGYVFVQHDEVNQGRCGECGDEWSLPRPRDNDEGGLYGNAKAITGNYKAGELIEVTIEVTISHKGWFEFRLCPDKRRYEDLVTQDCLDRNLLTLEDGSTRYEVPTFTAGFHYPKVRLPQDITCDFCVLQWYYHSANRVGTCEDGTEAVGCGDQETYVNCADISIV